jgi:3-isopropylmalate/(R)-2-methylmalate dehydratase large subunit
MHNYGKTLYEKIWETHLVQAATPSTPAIIYIDLHLVHEVTSPQAFAELRARKLTVRRPDRTIATMDHSTPTVERDEKGRMPIIDPQASAQLQQLSQNCAEFGVPLFDINAEEQGIVHVIGPELGLTQPGKTIVCGDSHTSTHGAFGALAFGIGTSEVGHVLATQCLLQQKAKTMEIRVEGVLPAGVSAKDIILAIIAKIGVDGGTSHVIEYTGSTIRGLTMEQRMTICNMSIEAGARAGLIAPDDITFEYLHGRRFVPKGAEWDRAVARWKTLQSDEDASYNAQVTIDATQLRPMITYGTNPGMGIPIDGTIPDPHRVGDSRERKALEQALTYMGLAPNTPILGKPVDVVFVGSCTNSRLSDLRDTARILRGRKIASGVRMLIVPGSRQIKREAEAEGLHEIFRAAGAEWREAGCSMCIAMNGDTLKPGQLAISTSNRNFEGRQGAGSRTLLASPLTAAASAVTGVVTDVTTLL